MKFGKLVFPVIFLLVFGLSTQMAGPAKACVGKTLVIGATESPQQQVLAQLLAILISERTGTSIKVVNFANNIELHEALLRADLDMYVEYTGIGQVQILQKQPIDDSEKLYRAVKEAYNEELNLIWLKPFGFSASDRAPAGTVADAAPVVRKDTLKKFPALARLINKLGGRIDRQAMTAMENEVGEDPAYKVARHFLKRIRLI